MARRRVYTGSYHSNRSRTITAQSKKKFNLFFRYLTKKFDLVFDFVMDYYILFGTLFFVLVMSFVLPDFAHKINTSKEVISLKRMVNLMSREVSRAEVACLTAADRLCYLQCTMQDGSTETTKTDLRDLSVCTSCLRSSSRAEPVHVEKKIGFLRRIFFPKRSSQQEVTIMSYVYTDSFDAHKPENATL